MPEHDGQSLASALEPVLRQACHGHLGEISWFKADWQRGGAGTGFSTWRLNSRSGRGMDVPCVVKMPIGYSEYFWTKRLGLVRPMDWEEPSSLALPTPRVLAAGFELGGYDLAWVVMERFANPPIAIERTDSSVWSMFETAAEFHAAAILEMEVDADKCPRSPDWVNQLEQAQEALGTNDIDDRPRWEKALDQVRCHLGGMCDAWADRSIDTWCHHDLHPHNCMRRQCEDSEVPGHCTLIDLAMVAPGCWIEDALYMERLFWGREEQLCGIDPLTTLAATRQAIGLPADNDSIALADVRRVLMAATVPAFLRTESDPVYLKAALCTLERLIPAFFG